MEESAEMRRVSMGPGMRRLRGMGEAKTPSEVGRSRTDYRQVSQDEEAGM
jgi:hypothetical protein